MTQLQSPQGRRVLIIEDEFLIALDLEETMFKIGFDVCALAPSASKARSLAMNDQPDVALVDVCLEGGREGIEIARWLREVCGVPIVFVTACGDARLTVSGSVYAVMNSSWASARMPSLPYRPRKAIPDTGPSGSLGRPAPIAGLNQCRVRTGKLVHLSDAQLLTIREWANSTPQVRELRLFGSYARGSAHEDSDVDLAVGASAGNWTALADTWERQLSESLAWKCTFARCSIRPSARRARSAAFCSGPTSAPEIMLCRGADCGPCAPCSIRAIRRGVGRVQHHPLHEIGASR
jgi:predicted nucleotidyltransferase